MKSLYSVSFQNIGLCRQLLNIHLVKGKVRVENLVVVFPVLEILLGMEKLKEEQKRGLSGIG